MVRLAHGVIDLRLHEIESLRELPVVIPVYSSREAGPWGRPRDQEVFEVGLSPAQNRISRILYEPKSIACTVRWFVSAAWIPQ